MNSPTRSMSRRRASSKPERAKAKTPMASTTGRMLTASHLRIVGGRELYNDGGIWSRLAEDERMRVGQRALPWPGDRLHRRRRRQSRADGRRLAGSDGARCEEDARRATFRELTHRKRIGSRSCNTALSNTTAKTHAASNPLGRRGLLRRILERGVVLGNRGRKLRAHRRTEA